MNINLLEALAQVPDFRAPRGRRYSLQLMKAAGDYGNAEQLLRISSFRRFCPSSSCSLGGTVKVATDALSLRLNLSTGNDYVVAVKANQKRLYQQIQLNTQQTTPISVDTSTERRSDRVTTRTVSVFDNLNDISSEWVGLARLVKVERTGTRSAISIVLQEASQFSLDQTDAIARS